MEEILKRDHHHRHLSRQTGVRLLITIILNIGITVSQVIGGVITGSVSLLSDALHNFSDVISLIISYIANLFVQKSPTPEKTFGYERAEILAAFVNALLLVIVALFLIKESIHGFIEPKTISSGPVIALALLSIILNAASALLILKDSKNNMNLRSSFLHLFSDMLTSVAVLLGGILMHKFQLFWVDSVISIGIAIYLITASLSIIQATFRVLMQFTPKNISVFEIQKIVTETPEVCNLHHVHIWQLSENEILLEGHLEFCNDVTLSEATKVVEVVNEKLSEEFNIHHTTLQPEIGTKDSKDLVRTHDVNEEPLKCTRCVKK